YWRERRSPTVIARFFNTVGPRQTGTYGMVVPRFVTQALRGEPITVYGDGRQSRCFTHVSDAVRAVIALMETDTTVGEVFNVGSTQEISILDLAQRVLELTGSDSPVEFMTYNEAYGDGFEDMPRRVPNLAKVRRAIGFEPQVALDDTLRSVIDYHRALEPAPAIAC
ncbi:MAG TPA: NAD-dependent epimerase/dehydratase family protein, partial [Longimicrobiales bacterium]